MKKILFILALGITVLCILTGCHKDKTTTKQTITTETTEVKTTDPKPTTTEQKTTTEHKEYYNGRIKDLYVDGVNITNTTKSSNNNKLTEGRLLHVKLNDELETIISYTKNCSSINYASDTLSGYEEYEFRIYFYNEETKTLKEINAYYKYTFINPEGNIYGRAGWVYTLVDWEEVCVKETTFTEDQIIEYDLPETNQLYSTETDYYNTKTLIENNWVKPEN